MKEGFFAENVPEIYSWNLKILFIIYIVKLLSCITHYQIVLHVT